jgi:hypothetical protein
MGEELADLQYYHLGQGEKEALTLTTHVAEDAVFVTDDFLALVVAQRLGLPSALFLDFVVGRARAGNSVWGRPNRLSKPSAPAIHKALCHTRSPCWGDSHHEYARLLPTGTRENRLLMAYCPP